MSKPIRLTALLAVIAMASAACGTAQGTDASTDPTDTPPVAGMCAPDHPDCVDTVVVPDDGDDTSDIQYRPIEPEGDVPGEAGLINDGELVSVEGNRVTIGFWMGIEDCYAVERVEVSETPDQVSVSISVAPRDPEAVCIEIAEARAVTVELAEPLGDRTLRVGEVVING